jgi:hypothetical protein
MLKDVNASLLKEESGKRACIRRYLQKPFYYALSKLATLFETSVSSSQAEASQIDLSKEYEPEFDQEQNFSSCFTDRVDPSLYYTVFFAHERF